MFRKTIFWIHLALGLTAGIAIAIMSFTGAALAFEKELIAWAERDARRIEPPSANTPRLSIDELRRRVHAVSPDARITAIAIRSDTGAAVTVSQPGNAFVYANPHTGELRKGHAPRMRAFMRAMLAWHIRLNFAPGPGNLGRTINSAANTVFVFLCLSGLILWWPRGWTLRAARSSLWFVRGARGRARDWNWHNVFGFWSLPALVIMAASGVVLSYRWAGHLVFHLAGEDPPSAGVPARPGVPKPPGISSSASPTLSELAPVFEQMKAATPNWEQITFRFTPALRGDSIEGETFTTVVRRTGQWPPFASTTMTIDARTGAVRRTETFAELSPGQRARRWIRLLHTGEALGWPGQLVAGIGCLAGVMLVWTGVALACRRFFGRSTS
jgi:uncharacterized iron-regulated membrane protein